MELAVWMWLLVSRKLRLDSAMRIIFLMLWLTYYIFIYMDGVI